MLKYKEIKEKISNSLKRIINIDELYFIDVEIDKKETIKDLTKFIVFIEEIESKSKHEGVKITKFKEQLLIISSYLIELEKILEDI